MLRAMRVRRYLLPLLALPLTLAACNKDKGDGGTGGVSNDPDNATPKASWVVPTGETELAQTVVATLDPTTDPCVDFYQYACGGWIANTELPDDKPRYGRGFGELGDRNDEVLVTIVAGLEGQEGDAGKAGAFYASCMDLEKRTELGAKPLDPWLKKIDKVKSAKAAMKLAGEMHAAVSGPYFSFGPSRDFKQPDMQIADLGQGGTGLPDRSFYLDEDKKPILEAYKGHVATMLGFVYGGDMEKAKADAEKVVAFEVELAKVQKPREEMRDPVAVYNRLDRKGVEKLAGKLAWGDFFKAVGYPKVQAINVSNPTFLEALPELMSKTDMGTHRAYLRYHLIADNASELSPEIETAAFQFTAAITGAKAQPPQQKRCIDATTSAFGDVIGKAFVEKTFAGKSKDLALEMITDIEAAMESALPNLEWMDEGTREAAVGKIKLVKNKVGYPNKWREYSKLELGDNFFASAVAAAQWGFKREMDKVGGKADPDEWFMPASIVNAFYNPLQNDMNFPAGIMQPPFFSQDFPRAMNYGAMGMVMGHELTHGFDDQGRKFDGNGVMQEWWAPEVAERFEARAACIDETYSAIEVQPGVFLNGKLTMGENIADHGGIREAYTAYTTWNAANNENTGVEGVTNEQLFFLAYAQSWCSKATPQIEALLATVDPHSPPKYRVNVPLAHYPKFWEVWSCGEGTPMHAANACEVW